MTQVYDYLIAFANYYEATYKWPLKIGRIFKNLEKEPGHIIVGIPPKMNEKLKTRGYFDLSELKWIVFDECDNILDIMKMDFIQILKEFSSKSDSTNANVIF